MSFEVTVGLRHGSVLRQLFFILAEEFISRRTKPLETQRNLTYADNLALLADRKEELVNMV